MKTTADVVVIGGGIMGASTAYHLAKRGCANVVVLEASEMFGLGSTGLNAGGIRYQFATAVNIELSKLSIAMMERFPSEMDQELGIKRCGYLFMLDSEADLDQFRRNVALQNEHGVPSCIVSTAEIAALAPEVDLTGIIGGSWCPRDGLVDPHGLLQGYVSNARRLGATLLTGTSATAIDIERRPSATRRHERGNDRHAGRRHRRRTVVGAGRRDGRHRPSDSADPPTDRRHGADRGAARRLSLRHRLLAIALLPP